MNHGQIQRSKIFVEWEISQVIVDVEEESILIILWWLSIGNPIQFFWDDFYWLAEDVLPRGRLIG